jgi:CubicO group peptidase (beta-lactamase class C family)
MQKIKILLLTLVLLSLLVACQNKTSINRSYREIAQDLMNQYDIPGMGIVVVENGDVILEETLGFQEINPNFTFNEHTLFRTESISKTLTSYIILRLVEENVLNLEDKVDEHLIYLDLPYEVSILDLLTHQSGLALGSIGLHYDPQDAIPSAKDNILKELSFFSPPKERFSYSNVAYNLLELVIEAATDKSFEEVFQEYIGEPLDLTDASFTYHLEKREYYAKGYDLDGKEVPMYVYPEKASGGFMTNIKDMAKLMQLFTEPDILLSEESTQKINTVQTSVSGEYSLVSDGYSFGHFIDQDIVFHGGQGHGWMAFFVSHTEDNNGLFMVTNSQRSYPAFSKMVQMFGDQYGYEDIGFSKVSKLLPYLQGLGIILIGLLFLISVSFLRSYKERRTLRLSDIRWSTIIQLLFLILLVGVTLYLYLADYVFLRVLYPNFMDTMMIMIILYDTIFFLYFIKRKNKGEKNVRN